MFGGFYSPDQFVRDDREPVMVQGIGVIYPINLRARLISAAIMLPICLALLTFVN